MLRSLEKLGGVTRLNAEAMVLFDRYGTNIETSAFLQRSDLGQVPAISNIGTVAIVSKEDIRIRFGKYPDVHWLLIFHPTRSEGPMNTTGLERIAPNIYVTGGQSGKQ